MRRHDLAGPGEPHGMAGGVVLIPAPPVHVEVCTCGCVPDRQPEWPLAAAWRWLTAPVEVAPAAGAAAQTDPGQPDARDDAAHEAEAPAAAHGGDLAGDDAVDPSTLPWWDARASAGKRRAVLPLVLLGELQAGVLLRAVWEVVRARPGSGA